ncbi:hypothetical protein [Rubellimicrobium mesophilum]|uniref:hypothetical protein n=1 Tax=Rubellimicrobium mesophilum TaxID=1123067 RepID=UPI00316AC720
MVQSSQIMTAVTKTVTIWNQTPPATTAAVPTMTITAAEAARGPRSAHLEGSVGALTPWP